MIRPLRRTYVVVVRRMMSCKIKITWFCFTLPNQTLVVRLVVRWCPGHCTLQQIILFVGLVSYHCISVTYSVAARHCVTLCDFSMASTTGHKVIKNVATIASLMLCHLEAGWLKLNLQQTPKTYYKCNKCPLLLGEWYALARGFQKWRTGRRPRAAKIGACKVWSTKITSS